MKRILMIAVLFMVIIIGITGCKNGKDKNVLKKQSDEKIVNKSKESKVIAKGSLDIDLENFNSEQQKKYDEMNKVFSKIKNDTVITVGTTSTANIFDKVGIQVNGAPMSKSLDKELTERQVKIDSYEEGTDNILNIGTAIDVNTEAILKQKPDYFIVSGALASMGTSYEDLEENGIKVYPLPQSDYEDRFILLKVLEDNKLGGNKLKNELKNIKYDLKKIADLKKGKKSKSVAIIQAANGNDTIMGSKEVVGGTAKALGINNQFEKEADTLINKESLIEKDPEVIFYYSHGMIEGELEFEKEIKDPNSEYSVLSAVKNDKIIKLGEKDSDYVFSTSVDLSITKMMLQLTKEAYE